MSRGSQPFWTGVPPTKGEHLVCTRGPFVIRHHVQSFSSEYDARSQWALTPSSSTPVPKGSRTSDQPILVAHQSCLVLSCSNSRACTAKLFFHFFLKSLMRTNLRVRRDASYPSLVYEENSIVHRIEHNSVRHSQRDSSCRGVCAAPVTLHRAPALCQGSFSPVFGLLCRW